MKRRLAVLSVLALMLMCFSGCKNNNKTRSETDEPSKNEKKAQMVVAMNPILVIDKEDAVIAYNDVKNAIKDDYTSSTLTSMDLNTGWQWVAQATDGWKKRAIYDLGKWTNGAGETVKTLAYAYSNDRKTSLASYTIQSTSLTAYNSGSIPEYGLLVSVSSNQEEAICYTVQQDGVLTIPEGMMTAIESVAGVKTGFLAEDGTPRKAAVRIMVNNQQLWSGSFANSTAAEDGVAVTELNYPELTDIKVSQGDMVFITFKLDAQANRDADVTLPTEDEESKWTLVKRSRLVEIEETTTTTKTGDNTKKDGSVPIISDYESTFVLVRSSELSTEMLRIVSNMCNDMVNILKADVRVRNEDHEENKYEIVIGPMKERPKSMEIYNELINARPNNANDFIIRLVGTKVYIIAANELSMQAAVNYFMEKFCKDDKGVIPAGFNYVYRPQVDNITFAGVNIGNYVIRTEKYPSYLVVLAAKDLQQYILKSSGYLTKIVKMTDDGKHYPYEIQVGPMNGSVKVTTSGQRFTNKTASGNINIQPDGLLNVPYNAFKVNFSGNHLVINGGSQHSINAAVQRIIAELKDKKMLAKGYSLNGEYDGGYNLSGGYALTFAEEFNYKGTDQEIETAIKNRWSISNDTTPGPTPLGDGKWDEQRRPGIYGENYWIQHDSNNNGYLLEITKKESYGYDAGRLVSLNKMAFRYGIWETRIVMGTRNGACSAIWASSGNPYPVNPRNEIDVYENFGQDVVIPAIHTWAAANEGGHVNHMGAGDAPHVVVRPAENEHFWDTFHYLAIEWTDKYLNFYLDGECYLSVDITPTKFKAFRNATTIKLANGVGTQDYSKNYNPFDFMDDVSKFFEVQTVDYTRIYQTSNEGKSSVEKSQLVFSKTYVGDPIG